MTRSSRLAATLLGAVLVWTLGARSTSARAGSESERLAAALALRPGMVVADVGAGNGEWTEELARRVGPGGRVFATEVEPDKVEAIESRAAGAGLDNVTSVLGDQDSTGLPPECCDAVLLRLVYHHFADPAKMRASLARAMRPGARLAIIDTPPHHGWRDLPGVPDRGGHGIEADDLVAEMTADGFRVVERHDDWPDDDAKYCVVFEIE